MKRFTLIAVVVTLMAGALTAQAATTRYPINRPIVYKAVKGAYGAVAGSHGAIHWRWSRPQAVATWHALAEGYEFTARVTATRPYRCVYSFRIQVLMGGESMSDQQTEAHFCG